MTIQEIFEKVSLIKNINQRQFLSFLNDTQDELVALYGEARVLMPSADVMEYDTYADFPVVGEVDKKYIASDTGLAYIWDDAYISILVPFTALTDEIVIDPLYHIAIVDNILFFAGGGDIYKSEFLRKSKQAYSRLWSINARNKRVKRMRW